MFDWLKNLAASTPPGAMPHHARSRLIRARYDAAVTNDDNRRHWANADGLSPNAAINAEVRRTLRNRARYEVANNSYARGIALTLANDCIGTGPRLQLLTDNPTANRALEAAFARWADAVGLAAKLRTMRMARADSGEAFAILTNNPAIPADVQLDLKLVEADQVTTPVFDPLFPQVVDGIVFDSLGNPIEYHILRRHPGENLFFGGGGMEFDRLPARPRERCTKPASPIALYRFQARRAWRIDKPISPTASTIVISLRRTRPNASNRIRSLPLIKSSSIRPAIPWPWG